MQLPFLRRIDRWVGIFLLALLALPMRLVGWLPSAAPALRPRHVFLKLKGGGSLIIAMPALLGLRRAYPQAEFVLVCTVEAKIYAELTGVFNRYIIIDDASLLTLASSGAGALRDCFRSALCVDLEPNSMLAALFTMLTGARQRMGLVKPDQPLRALAYSDAISFNPVAPIHIYYDQICIALGARPAADHDCREIMRAMLPPPMQAKSERATIGIAPFTSDFARERMMPAQTWIDLLRKAYGEAWPQIIIFGSARNQKAAREMAAALSIAQPAAAIVNLSGACDLFRSAATLFVCDEIWAVDSGLLHIARLLGIANRSFWGPTMPSQRLRPIAGLHEQVHYRPFLCSPCVQASGKPPCGGYNVCMISMADDSPDLKPSWVQKR